MYEYLGQAPFDWPGKPHEVYDYNYGLKDKDILEVMNVKNPYCALAPDFKYYSNLSFASYCFSIERCRHYIRNDFAIIKIRIQGSSYLKRVQKLKYSDADKFAIVGGTLGLFTGFSFIVIFELFYWLVITLKKAFTVLPKESPKIKKEPWKVCETKHPVNNKVQEQKKKSEIVIIEMDNA